MASYDTIKTPLDLDLFPTTALVDIYNNLTGKAIKSFHTRGKGIEQVFRALQEHRAGLKPGAAEEPTVEAQETTPAAPETTHEGTATVVEPKRTVNRPGRRGRIDPNARIKLLVDDNPKRPGTRAFAQFEAVRMFNSCTVAEFIAGADLSLIESTFEIPANKAAAPDGWTRDELIWCEKRGFIAPITKES